MSQVEVSLVIPISDRRDSLRDIVAMSDAALGGSAGSTEILLVVDGSQPERNREVQELAEADPRIRLLELGRKFGEGAALRAGLQESKGKIIVTHPAYFQVDGAVIPRLVESVRGGNDVAFASRLPEKDSWFNRAQRWVFNSIVRSALWVNYKDVACGVRALRRDALEDLSVHGSFHRFVPVLAALKGLRVEEVPAPQHPDASRTRVYSPGVYVRRLLDLVNIFFVLRFTYKPLRFFGLVGGALFALGFLVCAYLAVVRLFFDQALSDRPMLLVGVMLLALGFQLFALGLLGELITFTFAAKSKPYTIREIQVRDPHSVAAQSEQADKDRSVTPAGSTGRES